MRSSSRYVFQWWSVVKYYSEGKILLCKILKNITLQIRQRHRLWPQQSGTTTSWWGESIMTIIKRKEIVSPSDPCHDVITIWWLFWRLWAATTSTPTTATGTGSRTLTSPHRWVYYDDDDGSYEDFVVLPGFWCYPEIIQIVLLYNALIATVKVLRVLL